MGSADYRALAPNLLNAWRFTCYELPIMIKAWLYQALCKKPSRKWANAKNVGLLAKKRFVIFAAIQNVTRSYCVWSKTRRMSRRSNKLKATAACILCCMGIYHHWMALGRMKLACQN